MNADQVKIDASWKKILREEFEKPYFQSIKSHLLKDKKAGKEIYPPGSLIFNAFDTTPVEKVKVVIIGQDPYHQPGQAMGLSFSVPQNIRIPASLRNIYKEIHTDLGLPIPGHGDLTKWARQGVFLLNAILTVERSNAGSHRNIGWHFFTDAVIRKLSETREGIIFLLWGNFAKTKKVYIDEMKHFVLEAAHPSPLARVGFAGCNHFSRTNEILTAHGKEPIDWLIE
jgi:uracil-DNA glycosylase